LPFSFISFFFNNLLAYPRGLLKVPLLQYPIGLNRNPIVIKPLLGGGRRTKHPARMLPGARVPREVQTFGPRMQQ
jgi:hypothetical protein